MRPTTRAVAAVALAAAAVLATTSTAPASAGGTKVYTLDPSDRGNPEGIAYDPAGRQFFVGVVGDGTIYRGTLGSPTITPFIDGTPGSTLAVGMKVAKGLLYVAEGPLGKVNVYDTRSGALKASITTPGAGFLNDLVVTENGDVWVTDSFVPVLWKVTAAQVKAGTGTAGSISVAPEITFGAGFNLNGIVALSEKVLVVVQSNTGDLWRVALGAKGSRTITQVDAPSVPGGDGLLLDQGRLVVVQGGLEQLSFLALKNAGRKAVLKEVRTDPTLDGPSTVARAGNRYLVVNADFATSTPPYTVSGLPR